MADSKQIKFTKWRPVGVCDTAPPGRMKAQMFTREDYLIITNAEVTRENWKSKPEVVKVLHRYCAKLARMSSLTKEMKKPVASKIKLMGSIIKLDVTPTLNRESESGKMQLFQIEFEERALKTKNSLLWVLLIAVLLLFSFLGYLIWQKKFPKSATQKFKESSFQLQRAPFCGGSRSSSTYRSQLDEIQFTLANNINTLKWEKEINNLPDCTVRSEFVTQKEEKLLLCYQVLLKNNALFGMDQTSKRNMKRCIYRICSDKGDSQSLACR